MKIIHYWKPIVFILLLLASSLLYFLNNNAKLTVVAVGTFSGEGSSSGQSSLNGIMMAYNQLKMDQSIHKLEVLDLNSFSELQHLYSEIDRINPDLIIGPNSSTEYRQLEPFLTTREYPMLGVAVALDSLSGKADHFFRLSTPTQVNASSSATLANEFLSFKNCLVLFDEENKAYSEAYAKAFMATFSEHRTAQSCSIQAYMTTAINTDSYDGILIIAPPQTAGLTIQQIRNETPNIPILMTSWSLSPITIANCGPYTDQLYFTSIFNLDNSSNYTIFLENYKKLYGIDPNFNAMLGYENIHLLKTTLKTISFPNRSKLAKALSTPRLYNGYFDDYKLDAFGDSQNELHLLTYSNGQFKTLE